MSTITEAEILAQFSKLSECAKQDVIEYIKERVQREKDKPHFPPPGWGKKYLIRYVEDFEPYDDFKEYM